MLSRVAERLYWFARYLERAENTARLLLVRHNLILDLPKQVQPGWELLIEVLGAGDAFKRTRRAANEKNVVQFLFGERDNPTSILSSLTAARENLRTTREIMPSEAWELVNSLYLHVARRARRELPRSARYQSLNDIIHHAQHLTGMLADCMSHDEPYQFIRLGRNLERADMTSRIIDVGAVKLAEESDELAPYKNILWVNVLKSLSAYQTYRQNVRRSVHGGEVVRFLLHSRQFPRAVAYCLDRIEAGLTGLPHNEEPLLVIAGVKRRLHQAADEELAGQALNDFADALQLELEQIHQATNRTWFLHLAAA